MTLSPSSSGGGVATDTEIFLVGGHNAASSVAVGPTSNVFASLATSSQLRNLAPWAELIASDKALQARIAATFSIVSGGPVTLAMQVISANKGSNLAAQGAEFGSISTSSSTSVCQDSGWVDLPAGLTVQDLLGLDLRVKTASTTAGALLGCAIWLKAV